MAKLGASDRLKGKLDQSSWVDSAEWLEDGEAPTPAESVEFLEVEPSAYRLSDVGTPDATPRFSATSSRVVGLGALILGLVALVLISRPDGEDPVSQLSYEQQLEILARQSQAQGADTTDPDLVQDDAAAAEVASTSTLPQPSPTPDAVRPLGGADADDGSANANANLPVPPLPLTLSPELPDTLVAYGGAGSMVVVERSQPQPEEVLFDLSDERAASATMLAGDPQFGAPVIVSAQQFGVARTERELVARLLAVDDLLPSDDGLALVRTNLARQEVWLATYEQINNDPVDGSPLVFGNDLELLGGWQGKVLAHKGGTIWLLDGTGESEPVVSGVPLGYDGRYLSVVQCPMPDACVVTVGPVDQPELRSVPVPEEFADRAIESWSGKATPSPDGTRLALVDGEGVALPALIDLSTGELLRRFESVDGDSPVAWSPDGRWLAYAFNYNIVIWDTALDETWQIFINRQMSSLVWLDDGPDG
ncbi:MAG: hypothetical protein ACRBK7_27435 [Acidimicrobiales bacterium]